MAWINLKNYFSPIFNSLLLKKFSKLIPKIFLNLIPNINFEIKTNLEIKKSPNNHKSFIFLHFNIFCEKPQKEKVFFISILVLLNSGNFILESSF